MKIAIDTQWDGNGAQYFFTDLETSTTHIGELYFDSEADAQAYLYDNREELERIGLPPLSQDEIFGIWSAIENFEKRYASGVIPEDAPLPNPHVLLRLARQPALLEASALASLDLVAARVRQAIEARNAPREQIVLSADEAESRLDLARAHYDMGDPEGAAGYLGEVVRMGSSEYKARARRMLDEFIK